MSHKFNTGSRLGTQRRLYVQFRSTNYRLCLILLSEARTQKVIVHKASMSNLSATGALTAFGSGIMLGFGWALLNNDRFQDAKDVARTTIGGGFFVAGLYVWAPAGIRRVWLE